MTEASRAVFVSYASEDAEAASRISDALRAGGIEVWLDKSELRGGDAWDRRIRERIHDCRLFMAVISANTEARDEGYFRREWKLAVERSRDMSESRAFVVPVAIDNTPERAAAVPEKFHEVQWTRLPGGRTGQEFIVHILHLLAPEGPSPPATASPTPLVSTPPVSTPPAATRPEPSPRIPRWPKLAGLAAAVVIAGVAGWVVIERPWLSSHSPQTRQASATEAAATAPANGVQPSIAVLPFVNMSADKAQDYFADGLAEELLDLLAKTPGLHVIARTSSFSFKGKPDDIATIAAKLKVANILEGSVRKSGDRLRVTAQLIRADTSEHLWSDTFERQLSDVFKVQDEIAGAVAGALRVQLLPPQQSLRSELRTTNLQAYDLYLQGKESYNRGDVAGYQRAVAALRNATAMDSGYAAAYAELALAEFWVADTGLESTATLDQALAAAEKAVELAPEGAAGYAARGFVRAVYRFDFVGAQSDLTKAVALNSGDADVLHRSAVVLAVLGDLPAAIDRERKALALDPLSAEICMRLAFFYNQAERSAEARPLFEKALAIAPGSVRAHYNLGELELFDNHPEAALAAYRQTEFESFRLAGLAKAEYSLGHRAASQEMLQNLLAVQPIDRWSIATVYAWRGETDKTFEWLERAYRARDPGLTWIKIDRNLRAIRNDVRYRKLLREMRLPE